MRTRLLRLVRSKITNEGNVLDAAPGIGKRDTEILPPREVPS
jgi:hypothetical protein